MHEVRPIDNQQPLLSHGKCVSFRAQTTVYWTLQQLSPTLGTKLMRISQHDVEFTNVNHNCGRHTAIHSFAARPL